MRVFEGGPSIAAEFIRIFLGLEAASRIVVAVVELLE
jgi:hypothetical protein